jgi:hypothetical protein
MQELEMYLQGGWIGVLERRLGWLSLNFKKEWVNLKMPKIYSIDIWRHILISIHI